MPRDAAVAGEARCWRSAPLGPATQPPVPPSSGVRAITLDHRIFAALDASPGLHGPELLLAVILAQWAILIGPAVLAFVWLAGTEADRAAAVSTGIAAALALLLAAAISALVDAPRPFVDGSAFNYLAHVRDGSFPSDHATVAFALATGLFVHRPPKLPWVWFPLLAVAAAVGWARIFLGAHDPSDVAGAALLAAASVAAVACPAGRAASRPLHSLAEGIRARVVVGWRRIRPSRHLPGATEL